MENLLKNILGFEVSEVVMHSLTSTIDDFVKYNEDKTIRF